MPTIDFGPDADGFWASTSNRLRAVMLFPQSEIRRQAHLQYCHDLAGARATVAANLADAILKVAMLSFDPDHGDLPSTRGVVDRDVVVAKLRDGGDAAASKRGSETKEANDEIRRAAQGRVAGSILIYRLGTNLGERGDGISNRKARYLVEYLLAHTPKRLNACGTSEASIKNAWKSHRGVAHFWAAELLAEQDDRFSDFDDRPTVADMLGWADAILDAAVTHGIFKDCSNDVWRPPSGTTARSERLPSKIPREHVGRALEGYRNVAAKGGRGAAIPKSKRSTRP